MTIKPENADLAYYLGQNSSQRFGVISKKGEPLIFDPRYLSGFKFTRELSFTGPIIPPFGFPRDVAAALGVIQYRQLDYYEINKVKLHWRA